MTFEEKRALLNALIQSAAEIFAQNAEAFQEWRMNGAPPEEEPTARYEATLKVLEREIYKLWPEVNNRA